MFAILQYVAMGKSMHQYVVQPMKFVLPHLVVLWLSPLPRLIIFSTVLRDITGVLGGEFLLFVTQKALRDVFRIKLIISAQDSNNAQLTALCAPSLRQKELISRMGDISLGSIPLHPPPPPNNVTMMVVRDVSLNL
jgi:hypothetical protein